MLSCNPVRVCVCVAVSPAGLCLSEFVVNPHQQHMDPFQWVLDWEGMLSPSSLVGMLDKHFFPKWLQVSHSPSFRAHALGSVTLITALLIFLGVRSLFLCVLLHF